MEVDQPQCSRQVQAPVHGQLQQLKVDSHEVWQFKLEDGGCAYGLYEQSHVAECLKGSWVILIGASQTNIWTTQLANSLVENALLTKRDHFSIDGVFTQMIDIVIEMDDDGTTGTVVYKNVLRDPRGKQGHRIGAHTTERDNVVLKEAFNQATVGRTENRDSGPGMGSYMGELPKFTGKQIRITNFFAEYWDNVEVALNAVENAEHGWAKAEMTLAVSIGLWYINSLHCGPTSAWCATRPELGKLTLEGLVKRYKSDMKATMPKLQSFCSESGPAGRRGCAITSIDHCQFMQGAIWHMIYDAVREGMQPIGTPLLRFVDLWTFTLEIPEDCLGGHQSPMSTLWTWQVLFSGICKDKKASPALDFSGAKGTLAEFNGPMCRAQQVVKFCPNPKAKGFHYQWECALSELCAVKAIEAPESMRPIKVSNTPIHMDLVKASHVSPPSNWAASWRIVAGSLPFRLLLLFIAASCAVVSQCLWDHFKDGQKNAKPEGKTPTEEKKHLLADENGKGKTDMDSQKDFSSEKPEAKKEPEKPKALPADRFAFGLARCIASTHVVVGHLYAKSAIADFPAFGWGFTWVPWFFMLSGFILFAAEQRRPNKETCLDYVLRRSVNIYPLYAVGLILAFLIAKSEGKAPSNVILMLQAWLLQAWFPNYTEQTLNMQCWFLCCLVLYWVFFRFLHRVIAAMSATVVVVTMLALYFLPWLVIVIPLLSGEDVYWYQDHIFGHRDSAVDMAVVILKFHPFTFTHIFILGMLLAKLRSLIDPNNSVVRTLMEMMAPVGYLGLGLVFCAPWARPPAAKLSARLSVLLPLQSMVLLGLSGLPGFQPKVAEWASKLNFLESYSYAVYVNQFICWHIWPEYRVSVLFFFFLAAIAVVFVHIVQKPAEELLRKVTNNKMLLFMPLAVMLILPLLNTLIPDPELTSNLPTVEKIDSRLTDLRLPIKSEDGNDGSVLINPSLLFRGENEVIFVARRHRRSHRKTRDNCYHEGKEVTCIEEVWHSEIVIGSKFVRWSDWNKWLDMGTIPSLPKLKRWTGLRTPNNQGTWTNLCIREIYNKVNQTLTRLIVTGPEDPKVFQLTDRNAGPVDLAFSSYPPFGRHGCEKGKAVPQMYLATGIDVMHPGRIATGNPLKCGVDNRAEKNWIPFKRNGDLYFVYSILPHVVMKVQRDGTCGSKVYSNFGPLTKLQAEFPGLFFSGSAQAVFVNDTEATPQMPRPHYLGLFHVKEPKTGRYAHFAYRFNVDPPFQILQVSTQLPLSAAQSDEGGPGIAFASGLGIRDRQVVISYAAGDRESRALVMTLWKLDDMFNPDHVHKSPHKPKADKKAEKSPPPSPLIPATTVFAGICLLAGPLFVLFMKALSSGKAAAVTPAAQGSATR